MTTKLKSDPAHTGDKRNCILCGIAFDPNQTDDRACAACLALAVGGVGVDQGRRRHMRVKIDKPVIIRDESSEYKGQLANISYSGAAVTAAAPEVAQNQALELESDDIGVLSGNVARTSDDGFAMAFDMDDDAKTRLVDVVTGAPSDPDPAED